MNEIHVEIHQDEISNIIYVCSHETSFKLLFADLFPCVSLIILGVNSDGHDQIFFDKFSRQHVFKHFPRFRSINVCCQHFCPLRKHQFNINQRRQGSAVTDQDRNSLNLTHNYLLT